MILKEQIMKNFENNRKKGKKYLFFRRENGRISSKFTLNNNNFT